MKKRFSKRIHTLKDFLYHLDMLISHPDLIKKARENSDIHKKFIERIMLAVTQVNGCRLCSYAHTKIALESGLKQNEISSLLSGDLQTAPEYEHKALLFAQYYAETNGHPEKSEWCELVKTYGKQNAEAVLVNIRSIMIGNIYGNTMDAFMHRVKFQGSKESFLFRELGILIGLVPAFIILFPKSIILKKRTNQSLLFDCNLQDV
ncbi:MAG: carboxymuconolactone decarboxylase family protein [Bacteroidetes bacterium]|nr:carboxymuconolactone decarboxylase family protein [Bacteroidota bacterium]